MKSRSRRILISNSDGSRIVGRPGESLNAAIASSVLMFEAARQRRHIVIAL